jgi:hypothetical protein
VTIRPDYRLFASLFIPPSPLWIGPTRCSERPEWIWSGGWVFGRYSSLIGCTRSFEGSARSKGSPYRPVVKPISLPAVVCECYLFLSFSHLMN